MIYTGIGSRETPPQVINQMIWLGEVLANKHYILRSGGAGGADSAFEEGCDNVSGQKEIYLPVKKFNKHLSERFEIPKRAYDLARIYHPKYFGLHPFAKKCMARNVQQIMGENVQPVLDDLSDMVICWTKDGAETAEDTSIDTGGTGQAIRVAYDYAIPVFNLKNDDALDRLTKHLK